MDSIKFLLIYAAILFINSICQYDFRFARDCYNALEVSLLQHNNTKVVSFLNCCSKAGIPFEYLDELEAIQPIKKLPIWDSIATGMKHAAEQYERGINWMIRKEVNQMFAEDQHLRAKYYKWTNFFFRPWIQKKWKKLNEIQANRIKEIIKEFGFPGEKLIGIDQPRDHLKIEPNKFSAGIPIVILIHHFSTPQLPLSSDLIGEVTKGNIWPRHLGVIADFECEYGNDSRERVRPFGCWFLSKEENRQELNERRKGIGLMTLKEMEKLRRGRIMTKFYVRLY